MTAEWEYFVAGINRAELEHERAGWRPDPEAEAFGTREHHEMVHAHDYIRREFWDRMYETPLDRRRRMRDREERGRLVAQAIADAARARLAAPMVSFTDDDAELDRIIQNHPRPKGLSA